MMQRAGYMGRESNPLEDMRRAINKINNQTTLGDTRIIVPGTILDRAGITDDCVFIRYRSSGGEEAALEIIEANGAETGALSCRDDAPDRSEGDIPF